jgi:acetyltransferase-like isoleucine patch superfamily enzyme
MTLHVPSSRAHRLGDYANVITTSEQRETTSGREKGKGFIKIGSYCLICPGVRMSSATGVTIGDSCMMASSVYITDADWHGIYDRTDYTGRSEPIVIGKNVWLGDSSIVCKGVTIGDNSIIGAGSVVTRDIPADTIAAGNPAVPLRQLDEGTPMKTRADWFATAEVEADIDENDGTCQGKTVWLATFLCFPKECSEGT